MKLLHHTVPIFQIVLKEKATSYTLCIDGAQTTGNNCKCPESRTPCKLDKREIKEHLLCDASGLHLCRFIVSLRLLSAMSIRMFIQEYGKKTAFHFSESGRKQELNTTARWLVSLPFSSLCRPFQGLPVWQKEKGAAEVEMGG